MRVLVTGASGFVGRHVARVLAEAGHEVIAYKRAEPDADYGQIDAIVHLAGIVPGRHAPGAYVTGNVELTQRVAALAKQASCKLFVMLSSISTITPPVNDEPVSGNSTYQPTHPYPLTKLKAEAIVAELAADGLCAIGLRAPLIFGDGAKGKWRSLSELAMSSIPLPFKTGTSPRSVIPANYLAKQIAHLVDQMPGPQLSGAYTVAHPEPVALGEIIATMRQAKGKKARLLSLPSPVFSALAKVPKLGAVLQNMIGPLILDSSAFETTFGAVEAGPIKDAIAGSVEHMLPHAFEKRLLDFTGAAAGLIVFSPIILATMLAVKLDSSGPAIFAQTRVGRDGVPFTCYKLRTMKTGTGDRPSHETSVSALTRIGGFLRKTKLDELPQLLNVLKGEMSFVGPRPCLPIQQELIEARRERHIDLLRPGITGVAQIAGIDMSDPLRLARKDAEYFDAPGLVTDIKLILATLKGSGRGDRLNNET